MNVFILSWERIKCRPKQLLFFNCSVFFPFTILSFLFHFTCWIYDRSHKHCQLYMVLNSYHMKCKPNLLLVITNEIEQWSSCANPFGGRPLTTMFLKRLTIWNRWPMYIEINNSQPHSFPLPSFLYSHNCHPFLYHCHLFFWISIYPFFTIIFFPLSTIFIFLFIIDLSFSIAIPPYHIHLSLKLQLENLEPKNYTLYLKFHNHIAQFVCVLCQVIPLE